MRAQAWGGFCCDAAVIAVAIANVHKLYRILQHQHRRQGIVRSIMAGFLNPTRTSHRRVVIQKMRVFAPIVRVLTTFCQRKSHEDNSFKLNPWRIGNPTFRQRIGEFPTSATALLYMWTKGIHWPSKP